MKRKIPPIHQDLISSLPNSDTATTILLSKTTREYMSIINFLKLATDNDKHNLTHNYQKFNDSLTDYIRSQKRIRLSKQSNINIDTTVQLDTLYTKTVTNESNMFKGRNTLA